MEMLLTVPFFTRLPGSARVQMVDTLMTMLAKEAVWAPLSANGNARFLSHYRVQHCSLATHGCFNSLIPETHLLRCALYLHHTVT